MNAKRQNKIEKNRQDACNAYEAAITDLLAMAIELPNMIIDQYPSPDAESKTINWALVGTINHLRAQLKEIQDQICGTGEYAE